jgi:hypothetical protein
MTSNPIVVKARARGRQPRHTGEVDLASDASTNKSRRAPASKGFDQSLGVSATDLEAMCKNLLDRGVAASEGAP